MPKITVLPHSELAPEGVETLARRIGVYGFFERILLLTATPLEDDAHGFFRLLQLLRPEEFPEEESFEERLARLEEAGWVRREACPTDKRGALAVMTDEGFAAIEAAAPGHVEGVRRHVFDVLTPEQIRQLGEISAAIRDGLLTG